MPNDPASIQVIGHDRFSLRVRLSESFDRDRIGIARYRGDTVAAGVISFLVALVGSLALDAMVRPRRRAWWSIVGLLIHALTMAALFGLFLAGAGSFPVAAILTIAAMALFAIASNAKHAMLGEPLVFSDLALIAAMFRHPRFYFTAISRQQRAALAVAASVLLVLLAISFAPRMTPHLVGLVLLAGAAGGLMLMLHDALRRRVAANPDLDADLARHGLVATLLLYWRRWRETPDPVSCRVVSAPAAPEGGTPEIVVIVQCESFADPVELTGRIEDALPGLTAAREVAWQWGELAVSGFGAYTMRTEYGVLFGREEAALGFRRYDPFLTAQGEASYALPKRLAGYRCAFVHPHEMRFYNRDRLMPTIGFDRIVDETSFAPVRPDQGRYVEDRALGAKLGELIDEAADPTLLYAVTMENHGPWMRDQLTGSPGGLDAYLRHLRNSDAMLADLTARLSEARRPALLVFFGDHRPSIPGVTQPGGARHTPYVMLRVGSDGAPVRGPGRVNLTAAALHHAISSAVQRDVPV